MGAVFELIDPIFWVLAFGITLVGGFVKGAIGFAMPMIMISGFGSFLPPELALAALIVPTVLSNVMQTLRGGLAPAIESAKRFRRYIIILLIVIALSAQTVRMLPASALFLIVGVPITLISLSQILGWKPHIRPEIRGRVEAAVAIFAGTIGGVTGVWGPPTTAYLTAIDTPKKEQIRVQGVIFGVGAVVLFFAHLKSGILNAQTLPFSMIMVVPAVIGMMIGFRFQDRLDQVLFRKLTLAVLIIAGLNLIRRGLMA
ncbi:MAG: sulfite exporter TauE/SafE family protein [Paracoccaceae bacterium]